MDGLFQEMLGASNVDIDTNVDIVFAIDATESMQPLIDKVKSLTLSFREELEKGLKENRRIIKNLRIKVIVFRDYYVDDKYAMEESQFFILPEEKQEFYNFVSQIKAGGGGDEPESGLEALALALRSDFVKDGDKKRHVNMQEITPVLSDDEYRIVLTWSSTPSDLDSHLSGPLSTGERFHVYYSDMSAFDNGETVATLDLDDTSSYGPETITLKKTQDGIYKYAVHDYSNRSNASSTELSMSGAKVKLYCGNTLLATYNVPINVAGNIWNVFEIEGDTVQTINTMGSKSNPSMIFSDDVSGVSETALDIDKEQFGENKAVVDSGADSDFKKELDISEE